MNGEMRSPEQEIETVPGSQVLISADSMESPLTQLPAAAYDGIIVVSSKSPADVVRLVERAGGDPGSVGHVPISGAEYTYDGPMWTCDPLVPDDLTGLSMRLSRAFESLGDGWVLIENLNVFLLYASEDRVIRFFDHLTGLASDHGVTGVYAITPSAVAEETRTRLRHSVTEAFPQQ